MIEVQMTEDIRKAQPKTMGPFTQREVVCILIGLIYSIPIAILVPFDLTYKLVVFTLLLAPAYMCGSMKINDTNMEIVAIRWIYKHMLTPQRRMEKDENTFKKAMEKYEKDLEKKKISKLTPRQQKAYQKKKAAKNSVRYSNKKEYHVYR